MDVRPDYYRCDICGEECGKKDPKLRGNPRISHMECAEKEAKEIRDKVRKIKMKDSALEQEKKCISFEADPDLKQYKTVDDREWNPNEDY